MNCFCFKHKDLQGLSVVHKEGALDTKNKFSTISTIQGSKGMFMKNATNLESTVEPPFNNYIRCSQWNR